MLYYDFQNYEEFKEIFGIVEHGNGVKSRKNRILLAAYKDRMLFRRHVQARIGRSLLESYHYFQNRLDEIESYSGSVRRKHWHRVAEIKERYDNLAYGNRASEYRHTDIVGCTNAADAKHVMYRILQLESLRSASAIYMVCLMGKSFYSDKYETDDMEGLCEDGTLNAIRYRNVEKERVFKMRAGKMFGNLWECNGLTKWMPEQLLRWMGEEFVSDWTEYARQFLDNNGYTLHVDDNFKDIYTASRCKGYDVDNSSFGSCMVGDGQWSFYRDSVKAQAAYLTDVDDMIVARCIIFTEVTDSDGKVWRLAERQYSFFRNDTLKRQLVAALIRGGYIDGYKRVGSSCHDGRDFVDNEGNSLSGKCFRIECTLGYGDTLSYQDSFKNYDIESHIATNFGRGEINLATTDSTIYEPDEHEDEEWSEWNDEYIPSGEACYVESRSDWFWPNQVTYANVWNGSRFYEEDCFNEDCIEIDGEYYYAGYNAEEPESYGIVRCAYCDKWCLEKDAVYSDLTEEYYCDYDCCASAEESWHEDNGDVWSEWDEQWYADSEDVITAMEWCGRSYWSLTISVDSFNDLVENGKATAYDGDYFIDKVMYDGEPAHLGQFRKAA